MPQQINLFTPIQLTQQRHLSAQTMAQALLAFALLGGCASAYWVWSLQQASVGLNQLLVAQADELERLQAATAQEKAGDSSQVGAALVQDLQGRRTELSQREKFAQEWQRGLLRPGWGHAARLQLVAQSIPAQVWVTQVKADDMQFVVSGFTLEPAALNEWVRKLAASPLLQGQSLSAVTLEEASAEAPKTGDGLARPMWSFSLLSAMTTQPVTATQGPP
jgi:Tfp pilus assembly protein PilN